MRTPRINHTAAFKAKAAVAALKGDKTPADLAEKFDVYAIDWARRDLAHRVFSDPAR